MLLPFFKLIWPELTVFGRWVARKAGREISTSARHLILSTLVKFTRIHSTNYTCSTIFAVFDECSSSLKFIKNSFFSGVRHIINALQRGTVRSAKYADSYLAFRIKDYLLNNPRLQETFTELMDDLLHDVVKSSCSKAHPNSNLSRGEQIEKAYDGLNKKSFEVETN